MSGISDKYLSQETIDFARSKGITGPLIEEAERTMNSGDPRDVVIHRGLEKVLKDGYGHLSPTYKKNCQILHGYDDPEAWF